MDHPQFLRAALCVLAVLKLSVAADTLSANQLLDYGEVLISPNQKFELGFFSPGSSTTRFLGIWYKAAPDVVVWVANRENPINNSQGLLSLTENGNLILSLARSRIIWSSNSSTEASSPVLHLLDTGNLQVLVENSTNIWQSFDYPSDTRLPGMKMVEDPVTGESKFLTSWRGADDPSMGEFSYRIENLGLSQTVIVKGTQKRNRVVFWNGDFVGYPSSRQPAWKLEAVTNRGRLISVSQPFNYSDISRVIMNYSGSIQRYMMNEQNDGWSLTLAVPRDTCDQYDLCGSNGICRVYKTPVCECLRGFVPKSEEEWGIFNWSSGCSRNLTVDCLKEEGFLEVQGIKLPDSLKYGLNSSISFRECRDECLRNCNCTAYADPYFNNGSSCMMWFGDLIDMREYTGDTSAEPTIYIRVLIGAASGIGMLILSLCFGGLLLYLTW